MILFSYFFFAFFDVKKTVSPDIELQSMSTKTDLVL